MSALPPTIPGGLDLVQIQDGVIIRRKWFSWAVIPLLIFAAVWDSFLVFWYSIAFTHPSPWIMKVFPIGHVAVGFGITYFVIASFMNKTDVTVKLSSVEVRSHPAPWPGNKTLGANEITGIVVRQRTSNRRNGGASYSVMYAGQTRKERKLISCTQSDQAEFIANAIRTVLNLAA